MNTRPTRVERKDGSVYVEHYRPTQRGYWQEAMAFYNSNTIWCQLYVWVSLDYKEIQ